jgi:WW domain-containing oxidoreductase
MTQSTPFSARSTADQVLAGVDLTRKRIVVTGCPSGIGLETMKALAANGAHVIGLARTLDDARTACNAAGTSATPIACNLADFNSIDSAADSIGNCPGPLDAIVTSTEFDDVSDPKRPYGIELQSIVEYIGHFALVNRLAERIRSRSGRIVMVCNDVAEDRAPAEGATRHEVGHLYAPLVSHGRGESANAIYAKELSRRLAQRGVAVNSLHSGSAREAGFNEHPSWTKRLFLPVARLFTKSAAQRAATAALLAASPQVVGISGEHWSDCQITRGNPRLTDEILAKRLWETSEQIVFAIRAANRIAHRTEVEDRRASIDLH